MADAKTALATRRENGGVAVNTIADDIRKMEKEFQLAMPHGAEAQQLIRDALTALRTTRNLDKCDSPSVLGALMTCAQLDLRVGVLGQAWPVPFWDKNVKGFRAQLIVGYRGYVELAHRSEKVQSLMPRVVYENDEFDIDYGVGGTLVHKPAKGKRGAPVGYHAIVRYRNGGYDFIFMTQEEMNEHRDKFATTRNKDGKIFGPWIDHPEAMGQKTTLRLLTKYVPMSPAMERAAFVDGGLRIDLNHLNRPEEVTEQPRVLDYDDGDPGPEEPPALQGPMTEPMKKKLMALAAQVGFDRDQRLAYASQILDRPITTFNQLNAADASKVLDVLDRYAQQEAGPQ